MPIEQSYAYRRASATITSTLSDRQSISSKGKPITDVRPKLRSVDHVKISGMTELSIKYTIGKEIGKGAFGVVLFVTDKFTDMDMAIKVVEKKKRGKEMVALEREIQIMKMVNHPHIVYLFKVYECPKKIYLLMELCQGDLDNTLKERKQFDENDTRKIINELFSAVAYLHKNDIVHRDVKLNNLLLAKNPRDDKDKLYIKLTDFGLSVIKGGHGLDKMLREFCGTLQYMSPELVLNKTYSHKCDIWASGVIMYLLLTGKFPFTGTGPDNENLIEHICNNPVDFKNVSVKMSLSAEDLIDKLLKKDPALRITANEALAHPFAQNLNVQSITSMPENIIDMMKKYKQQLQKEKPRESSLYKMPPSLSNK